ncbi:uncharacterized protein MONOS_17904 [Monocercomonoides exilis]|uniref:uncharacterized protein n=1 Tax=Monocercomonoides exilis TaxID=2049356 RepID=UPI00355A7711|nr:hypothetical protein MONOS_17904 [Monocercomonoides exilis]
MRPRILVYAAGLFRGRRWQRNSEYRAAGLYWRHINGKRNTEDDRHITCFTLRRASDKEMDFGIEVKK